MIKLDTLINRYSLLVILVLACILIEIFKIGYLFSDKVLLTNTLDFSWNVDIVERLLKGYIAGKDFIFTYGPLYQFVQAIPSLLFGVPSYVSVMYFPLILKTVSIIVFFLIASAIAKDKNDRLVLTLLFLTSINFVSFPDPNNILRILFPFIYAFSYHKFIISRSWHYLPSLLILAVPSILGLYVFDLFILCFIVTLALGILNTLEIEKKRIKLRMERLKIFPVHMCIILLIELIVSLLLTGNLAYLAYSFDTVRSYQFIMNIPLSINYDIKFIIFPLLLIILSVYLLKTDRNIFSKKIILILLITSLLQLKSAVIRTDEGHIITATYPSLISSLIIIYFLFKKKANILLALISLMILFALIPYKSFNSKYYSPENLLLFIESSLSKKSFFEIYKLPNDYYYTKEDFQIFSRLIIENQGKVMIYPYDNYILNIFNQTYNTLPLQFYQYSSSLVEREAVAKLIENPPKYIILGVDTKGAVMLDNIPNFSRNPILTQWMLKNYSVKQKRNNYLILSLDLRKKDSEITKDCSVFFVEASDIMRSNLIDNMLKPSTFYLNNDEGLRLPFMPDTKDILLIENFDNSTKLSSLFEARVLQETYSKQEEFVIIKKYFIPKIVRTYNQTFKLRCTN